MIELERFEYAGKSSIFENLSIWNEEKYRQFQGTYPVIYMVFSGVKAESFDHARKEICNTIKKLYNHYEILLESDCMISDENGYLELWINSRLIQEHEFLIDFTIAKCYYEIVIERAATKLPPSDH